MVLSMFLQAIAQLLHVIITIYIFIIVASALVTWVNPDPYNKIVQFLYRATQPVYNLVRKTRIPTAFGGIDIAPVIVLLVLEFLDLFVVRLINAVVSSF